MAEKKYKKRVIQESSSSSSDEGVPLTKRLKSEPAADPAPAPAASAAPVVAAPPAPVIDYEAQQAALFAAKEKERQSIFTTGSDSEDDVPLAAAVNGKKRVKQDSSSEDDKPLAKKVVERKKAERKVVVKEDDSSSEDEKLLAAQVKAKAKAKATPKLKVKPAPAPKGKNARASTSKREDSSDLSEQSEEEDDDDDDSDAPLAKAKSKAKPKAVAKPKAPSKAPAAREAKKEESETPKKEVKGKGKKEDGEEDGAKDEEEVYRWWDVEDDGVTKWSTLEHNGILFPPDYEAHGIKMKYDGQPVDISPEAEEVASFFAAILETDYPKNPVFVKNFFDSFRGVLKEHPTGDGNKIKQFDKCDFTPIFAYLEAEKAKKKEMSNAEKKLIKAARDILEAPYKTCLLDGRKEKVGNFRVEPPGLFRGRGEHPKTGLLKTRVKPEQITVNIGRGVKVPEPPAGHRWKDVVHDDKVTWLATWKENINGAVKYVFLAAGSSLKGQSDYKKFEKARALKEHIDAIRRDYTAELKSKEMMIRQRATAIYFIDRFALRNGNEKGEDEADTVGCCSLRYEHVTLTPPTKVTFDFLGKDSIRYTNEVEVDEQVFRNLKIFKKEPKTVGDLLFDRVNTGLVNKYLTAYMLGLTAKVFRTYNASWTFVQQLKDTPEDASVADKILAYNRANRLVAVLCNHQRSVSKGHGVVMEKMADKIRALKYQRRKLRYALLALAPDKKKKAYKEFTEDESDVDDDWIEAHEANLVVLEREKIRKKFEKDNKKLEEANEPVLAASELKDRLKAAVELEKTLQAERKKGWKQSKLSEDKLVAAIRKMDERITVQKTAALDRDEGKEVSLGTSKINYLDPRITFAWCKKHGVPVNKLLSRTLVEKFTWAAEVEADFDW